MSLTINNLVSGTLDTGKELTKEEKEELLKKIDFIQKHSKPYKTVEAHWQDTYEYRNKGETPIHDYYSTYPILSTKDGYKLVSIFIFPPLNFAMSKLNCKAKH